MKDITNVLKILKKLSDKKMILANATEPFDHSIAEYYRGKSHAYAIAVDIIESTMSLESEE